MDPPALSEADFNSAIRRLQSVTGENPTDPARQYTLPEGLEWMTEFLTVLWPSIQKTAEFVLDEQVKPRVQGILNDLPSIAHVDISTFSLGTTVPAFGPMSTRRVAAWGSKKVSFKSACIGDEVRMVPEGEKGDKMHGCYHGTVLRVRDADSVAASDKQQYPHGYIDIKWNDADAGGPAAGVVKRAARDKTPESLPRESRQGREWWEKLDEVPGSGGGNPHTEDQGLQLNLCVSWKSNMMVMVKTNVGELGMTGMTFNGTISLWLRPFVPRAPIVGAVEMGFVNAPQVSVDLSGALLTVIPGIRNKIQEVINQQVAAALVLPNRIAVPLDSALPRALIGHPLPEGILKLTVLRCDKLPSKDTVGKSDPYVVVRVGAAVRKTETIEDASSPRFGGGAGVTWEFPVYDEEQWVFIEVRDDDPVGYDVIGQVHDVPVKKLLQRCAQQGGKEVAIPLVGPDGTNVYDDDDADPAKVYIQAEWLGIDDSVAARGDCIASVQVEAIRLDRGEGCVPFKELPPAGQLYVRATVGGFPAAPENSDDIGTSSDPRPVTKGSSCDPAVSSSFRPNEVLEDIHMWSKEGQSAKEVATALGFFEDGDLSLIEEATKRSGDVWEVDIAAPLYWWQAHAVMESWVIWRSAKQQKEKGPDGKLRAVWTLAHDGSETRAESSELKVREAWYERVRKHQKWCDAVTAKYITYKTTVEPYWGQVLHTYVPSIGDGLEVRLDFLQGPPGKGEKMLGSLVVKNVRDLQQSVAIESTGAASWESVVDFDKTITGQEAKVVIGKKVGATLRGSGVWIRDVVDDAALPASWNSFQAAPPPDWQSQDAMDDYYDNKFKGKRWKALNWPKKQTREAMPEELKKRKEWYDGRKDVTPQSQLTGDARNAQEAALQKCLNCGALTWGDYDTLIRKLQGEKNVSTVAETLEWVNMLIAMMWAPIDRFLSDWTTGPLKDFIDTLIKKYQAWGLRDVTIAKCSLGSRPLSFGTIQCVKKMSPGGKNAWGSCFDGCTLKVNDILLDSDLEILIAVDTTIKTLTLGAKNVFFRGSVCVDMGPMLPRAPCIAGVRVTFPATPDVSVELSGVKVPGLDKLISEGVEGAIAQMMVAPHFFPVVLDPSVDTVSLAYPEPLGVLEIELKGAVDLIAGDSAGMMSSAGSDAYAIVSLNGETLTTPVVTEKRSSPTDKISPKWTEQNKIKFVVYDMEQRVRMSVWDKDLPSKDDCIGTVFDKRPLIGGNEVLVQGRTVQELIRKAEHNLPLRFKVEDKELSDEQSGFQGDIFHKLQNYPADSDAKEGRDADLVVGCRWLTKAAAPADPPEYLLSFKATHLEGLPRISDTDLGAPLLLRCWVGKHAAKIKAGESCPSADDVPPVFTTTPGKAKPGSVIAPLDLLTDCQSSISELAYKYVDEATHQVPEERKKELAEEVGRRHHLSTDTVQELLTEKTWLDDNRCILRLHFFVPREEANTYDKAAAGGKNLLAFRESWTKVFDALRSDSDPTKVKEKYKDSGKRTGLVWLRLGTSLVDAPFDYDAGMGPWAGKGGEADLAIATIGFESGTHYMRWLRTEGEQLLADVLQFLDPRPLYDEDPYPVSITALKEDALMIGGDESAPTTAEGEAGPVEKELLKRAKFWQIKSKDSQLRANPDATSVTVVMHFAVKQDSIQQFKEFRHSYVRKAMTHRGIYSCCIATEPHNPLEVLHSRITSAEDLGGKEPLYTITLTCDDIAAVSEHFDAMGRQDGKHEGKQLFSFPSGAPFARLRAMMVITHDLAKFQDSAGCMQAKSGGAQFTGVQTEIRSIAKAKAKLEALSSHLEVQAKSLAWGKKASDEQQLRLAAKSPYFDQVLRGVVSAADLEGCSGSCDIAIGLLDKKGETVHGVISRQLSLGAAPGGRQVVDMDEAQLDWLVPASGGFGFGLLGGSKEEQKGSCKFNGSLTLQALAVKKPV
eukprot:TRINITY_DN6907_c0_g1_i2.p1 TRINITY_DN6907_c0_g1~~TRINITY_DN6907_c0_g1_i2.p1  ORF type:complete len:2076 (+),score=664.58 TRINITY_DN6907_c0_g1_i2:428-6229(+)